MTATTTTPRRGRPPRLDTRWCQYHGDTEHTAHVSRTRKDGSTARRWICRVCHRERTRVAQYLRRREAGVDTRDARLAPMAPVLPGVVRPASMTMPGLED